MSVKITRRYSVSFSDDFGDRSRLSSVASGKCVIKKLKISIRTVK